MQRHPHTTEMRWLCGLFAAALAAAGLWQQVAAQEKPTANDIAAKHAATKAESLKTPPSPVASPTAAIAAAPAAVTVGAVGTADEPTTYKISGPTKAVAGQLVRLTADGSGASSLAWMLKGDDEFPSLTDDYVSIDGKTIERGKYFTFAMPAGKAKQSFNLIAIVGGQLKISSFGVALDGTPEPTPPTPGPTPPGPIPPGPAPAPDGPLGLAKVVRDSAARVVDPDKAANALKIAGNYSGVASAIAAGGITTHDAAQKAMADGNRAALGGKVDAWAPCLDAIRAALNQLDDAGKLSTLADVQAACDDLSAGFKQVK